MVKVITPDEVRQLRPDFIPEIIFNVINELICQNFDGKSSVVYQDDIISKVCNEENGLTPEKIFKMHYLDIEDIYRKNGWKVEYDKPGYCESYKAFFTFTSVN